jgi:pimeloyl-ACP methyl ester carboxylesterase
LPAIRIMEHTRVRCNGLTLHVVECGEGEPVVLLHGFPEFWYSWRHQLPALAAAGYRAIAPDLRGYNLSERPTGVAAYRTRELVADVADLIATVAGGRAYVVGHDWGGVIAWRLAAQQPELVEKLVILNAPHPAAYRGVLARHPSQWLRSWYVGLFQLPWLPERLIAARDFALLARTLRRAPHNPNAFTDDDLALYKTAFRQPGALTAALNYYRAALRFPGDLYRDPQTIEAPTLVVWGDHDPFLSRRLSEGLERWAPNLRVVHLAEAAHFVQNESPERVNQELIEFLAE